MSRPHIDSSVTVRLSAKDIAQRVTTAARDDAAIMAALRRDYRQWTLPLGRLCFKVVWKRKSLRSNETELH